MKQELHTQAFVDEMKQRLISEQEQLTKELAELGHEADGDHTAKYPEYGRNPEENATEIADFQARFSTTETLEERLQEVEEALRRIEKGSYGTTSDGTIIPEERLRANPAATTLVSK